MLSPDILLFDTFPIFDGYVQGTFFHSSTVHRCFIKVFYSLTDAQMIVKDQLIPGADKSLARPGRKQATATKL